ncbi:RNA polymerase sigma-70 factor, ECF subfamily [Pedobacter xixiisoli]|uniref:RNA polymerase sigma-70 factor, ECF subfamily n=2 Tax=Pedobacter xixiisoli TaxID=1476464 RepID=A0A286A0C5_9SPHI|nr:RNA polymerase sigma-70 factor, ECF subfamily [Pedobacter xixiisoli]
MFIFEIQMDAYQQISDTELLQLLQKGDRVAFAELFQRYHQSLYLHAKKMLRDSDEAKDVVQEVFAAIWSKRETLALSGEVAPYLYGATRNRILNIMAHQQVVSKYADSITAFMELGVSYTEDQFREKELAQIIEREIASLPDKMREVFELSRKEELSYKEIAERLNISEHTVKKQAQRALKILRLKIRVALFIHFLPF